jgi:hypothetical protein
MFNFIYRIQKKMAETFGTGTPKDEDVVVLYKGESKQVRVVLPKACFTINS